MFNPSVFSIFDTLNSLMTAIATIFMYAVAITLPICIVQSVIARYINTTTVSNEFNEQVKDLMSLEVEEVMDSGVALAITVEPTNAEAVGTVEGWADIDFSKMNIRTIREYVRTHNKHSLIREATQKSVAKCTLVELRSALIENQQVDLRYAMVSDRL